MRHEPALLGAHHACPHCDAYIQKVPTSEELRAAAGGIAYRCDQLAMVALMMGREILVDVQSPDAPISHAPNVAALDVEQLVSNAFVESALVHARGLAYFLSETKKPAEVKAADYERFTAGKGQHLVDGELAAFVRSNVLGPVSNHLAHSKYAGASGNAPGQHPGRWPIPELAVVLVGGVALAVTRLSEEARSWFVPSPVDLARMIEYRRSHRTYPSGHGDVRKLTKALAARLDAAGTTD